MRESIGTTFTLNFIIFFMVLVFAFLAATLSYYKAYKVNNRIVQAIEKYEGYNDLSKQEIENAFLTLGYDRSNLNCSETRYSNTSADSVYNVVGQLVNSATKTTDGYCVYLYMNDGAVVTQDGKLSETDKYYSYGVTTYMKLTLPVVQYTLKLPIFSKTNRMYYFGQ